MQFWPWQYEPFDAMVVNVALEQQSPVQWVDCTGNPTEVSGGMVANVQLASFVKNVTQARAVGHVEHSCFRDLIVPAGAGLSLLHIMRVL